MAGIERIKVYETRSLTPQQVTRETLSVFSITKLIESRKLLWLMECSLILRLPGL